MMREFVGVKPWLHTVRSLPSLKREALMFNRLAIPDFSTWLRHFKVLSIEQRSELEWLYDNNIIFEPERIQSDQYLSFKRRLRTNFEDRAEYI
jgi:hypothetical protein